MNIRPRDMRNVYCYDLHGVCVSIEKRHISGISSGTHATHDDADQELRARLRAQIENSAQPCGCDAGAKWVCAQHQKEATVCA